MSVDPQSLITMVESELERISDARVTAYIKALLVAPTVTMRDWDYGNEGDQFACWTVFCHPSSNSGIAYCEFGFGPRSPWGLVALEGEDGVTSIGMDSGWFTTFLEAFFDSFAVTYLPIWRVVKTDLKTQKIDVISGEGEWDTTWTQVMDLRKSDTTSRYDCRHSIEYERV